MLLATAILLASAQDAPPAKKDTVVRRVPGSFLHVAIDIPGFTTDDRNAKILAKIFGDRGVLVGAVPSKLASVELLASPAGEPAQTDERWRDENLADSGTRWKQFEAAGTACGELSMMIDGSGSHDFHSFFVRGGFQFDLHVGETTTKERQETITKEDFVKMLESLRFAVVRRGTWEQMPEAALDVMHQAILRKDGWKAWLKERSEAAKDDYATQFAAAEVSRHFGAPFEEQIPLYLRTIEILDARPPDAKPLSAKEALALAASEDGLAIAFLDSGAPEKALPHLERALKVAHDLTAPIRAGVAYNLACAHARLGHEEHAVAKLIESENMEPGAFFRARTDKDFDKIRQSKPFQALLNTERARD
ncbi:MAG: TPR end-of-group domain-containing protein [Planctomycetota bacterium]